MAVDGALVALEVVPEDLLHELHARVDAAGIAGEGRKQLELGGGQVDLLPLDHDLVSRDVNHEVTEVEHLELRLGLGVSAAEQGAHAGDELARREGLDEVVVGTQLEADDAILDLALGGEHDDGHVRGLADGAADALAGELGEHQVEDDEVERVLLELLDGALPIAHPAHDVVLSLEVRGHCVTNGLLVLDQQNLLFVRSHVGLLADVCQFEHIART